MKAKALLLAAAVFAVGAGTSMAQVYSANAVGYVNMTLQPGFSLISNPLDNTNNSVPVLFSGVPAQTRVYRFNPTTQGYEVGTKINATLWNAAGNAMVINPGEGFFISIPGATPVNVTFVGEVPQGSLSNPLTPGGYQIKSSQVPQALPLGRPQTAAGVQTLGFPANVGDVVFFFNGSYTSASFRQLVAGQDPRWVGSISPTADGPVPAVGQGFFLFKAAGSPTAWTRTFSVN